MSLRVTGARAHPPPRAGQGVTNPHNSTNGPPTPCYTYGRSEVRDGLRGENPRVTELPSESADGKAVHMAQGSRWPRDRIVRYARGGEP